ncbi:ferredoxin reductase [Aromatoleum sp.]|uniref:ferredoxin reductase n=1 Tax=Aromatoleum sp. TaxID=2307007 RepID=UPI002FC91EBB
MDHPLDVRVTEIEQVTPLIKRFTLEAADGEALPSFSAGSHIVIEMTDGDSVYCSPYSLIGSPWESGPYRIAVRRSEKGWGGSHYMHEKVGIGSVLRISAPVNLFPLIRTRSKHVLIAGGVGVTPFFAHLAELRAMAVPHELHYAVRNVEHAGFVDELRQMIGDDLHVYVSDDGQSIDFDALLAPQPQGAEVYVCGPERMVAATFAAARAAGWHDGRVHAEQFASPAASVSPEGRATKSGSTASEPFEAGEGGTARLQRDDRVELAV